MSFTECQEACDLELPHLWESPFDPPREHVQDEDANEDEISDYGFDGFHTYPDHKPWSDLLIDISMTTAFNSLSNGVNVISSESCISYVAFLILVWWTWASRVAYDVRFAKSDWIHRISLFLQFIIFGALAAFTKDFDIGYKIVEDVDQRVAVLIQQIMNYTASEINDIQYRLERLPLQNARGTSMVMFLGRLLLLVQYVLVLYRAPNLPRTTSPLKRLRASLTGSSYRSLQTHIVSLLVSSLSYLVAFIVLDSHIGSDKGSQVVKIILWYSPIVVEIGAHYIASTQHGHSRYPSNGTSERCAAAFVIILGGGLDKITEGFQLLTGNTSVGGAGAGVILASAIVFIAQYAMYFEMSKNKRTSRTHNRYYRRVPTLFFFHFVYFAALIVMLQAIAALLQFNIVGRALTLPQRFLKEADDALLASGASQNLTSTDFNISDELKVLGLDIDDFVQIVNEGVVTGQNTNTSVLNPSDAQTPFNTTALQVAHHAVLEGGVIMIYIILGRFDASPDPNTALGSAIELYITTSYTETNFEFNNIYEVILGLALITDANPALWFFGSAGATLISLGILSLIAWWKDLNHYRKFVVYLRLFFGVATCLLSLLDINYQNVISQKDKTNVSIELSRSLILNLVAHSLPVPLFAIILACDQAMELIYIFVKSRKARSRQIVRQTDRYDLMEGQDRDRSDKGVPRRMTV